MIKESSNRVPRPMENVPGPGQYDGHLIPFGGDNLNKMTMGSKYIFKADQNPAVGSYDIERADKTIRFKSPDTFIRKQVIEYRRP
jgi:hypothetical protein